MVKMFIVFGMCHVCVYMEVLHGLCIAEPSADPDDYHRRLSQSFASAAVGVKKSQKNLKSFLNVVFFLQQKCLKTILKVILLKNCKYCLKLLVLYKCKIVD